MLPAAAGENIQINDLAAARATALLIGIPSEFSSLGQGHVERGLGENAVDLETEGGSPSGEKPFGPSKISSLSP